MQQGEFLCRTPNDRLSRAARSHAESVGCLSAHSGLTMADQRIVEKFHELDALEHGALPIASLSMLWYLDDEGKDSVLWKFDGEVKRSVTVGDLTFLIHHVMHDERDDEDDS